MKLGPIHVVTEATMGIMQGMIQRLAGEMDTQKRALGQKGNPLLLHSVVDAKYAPLFQVEPDADDERSREIIRRVVKAYQRARAEFQPAAPGMWDHLEGQNARPFVAALYRGDETEVRSQLREMFRTNLVWGLGCVCEQVWLQVQNPAWHAAYQVVFTDKLVALAEAVGVHRVRSPEQEAEAFAKALDVDPATIFVALERHTGLDLTMPEIGGIYGCDVNGRKTTIDSVMHGYTVHRLQELGGCPGDAVAEIGGGYGCLALLMYRAGFTHYTVYDLPWVNALQGYFLAMALPPGSVQLFGEETGTLAVLPGWCFARGADRSVDYAVNTNSLPEIGGKTARGYLSDIRRRVRKLFLSINHEARTAVMNYEPQQSVAEMMEQVGGFQRLSRSRYWVRNGYVEEVFRPILNSVPADV
ncbi:MAG TPA: hypothetical protein VGJ05_10325 [Fimbriiglobus sp.]|jgi:hypothetical protein